MTVRPITEDDLHAYVDRVLDDERRTEVAEYLESHPDVAKRVEAFSVQRDLLRTALAPIAEEPVPARLNLARIAEGGPRTRSVPVWWAAAAVVLIALGGIGGWIARGELPGLSAPSGLAMLAREAADSYLAYAPDRARPVEVRASEGAQLVQWASNRLQKNVKVPDLATAGYRLMGGRVVPTSNGPAAMFMYDNDRGERLVVLTRPTTTDQGTPMMPRSSDGVSSFAWADRGMGYSLVGPSAPETLRPIANEVRRQAEGPI
jgi:anti-sigma factor RsiW